MLPHLAQATTFAYNRTDVPPESFRASSDFRFPTEHWTLSDNFIYFTAQEWPVSTQTHVFERVVANSELLRCEKAGMTQSMRVLLAAVKAGACCWALLGCVQKRLYKLSRSVTFDSAHSRSPVKERVVFLGHFRGELVRIRVVGEVGGVARFSTVNKLESGWFVSVYWSFR